MEPFLSREATAHGWSAALLRTDDFARPVDGVAMLRSQVDDLASRCRAVRLVLPDDAVFTHLTSARLRGWWLPQIDLPLIIACSDGKAPHHDRRGVYVRRCRIPRTHRQNVDGVPVASPAWTVVELAEHLRLIDLVAVIDGALHHGDLTVTELRSTMVPGRRGVRVLRRALDIVDERSESPWETFLRLLHVLGGVAVQPQAVITNEMGVVIARADLRIRGTRRLAEYDGSDHRDRRQHERDLTRDKELIRRGFERYGYIAAEILRDPDRILRDADEALERRHDPTRVESWRREVAASSLSPSGRRALDRRLARFVRESPPRRPGEPTSRVAQNRP
ncbi:hypothetical protein ACHAAC_14070 [Aeromicrobium sp. CF4.19]|uniref:hypothetical protein n=1 Tax=Aeromicrobium sp. CF4.19 TaxID=3373082 RepID=UPI003EE5CC59